MIAKDSRVAIALILKDNVSVPVVPPEVTPETPEMDRPDSVDTTSKSDALTPATKVVFVNVRLSVELFRFDQTSCDGLDVTDASTMLISNMSWARSLSESFVSESITVTTILLTPKSAGVPQMVRGGVCGQSPLPSASNTSPSGKPSTL